MRVQCIDGEIIASDESGNISRVGVKGWSSSPLSFQIPENKDDYLYKEGKVDQLSVEPVNVAVLNSEKERIGNHTVKSGRQNYNLPIQLRVDNIIQTQIWIDSSKNKEITIFSQNDEIIVESPQRMEVWIGFELTEDKPVIQVKKDTYNLTRALSVVHRTTTDKSPNRTSLYVREPPARVEWGESVEIPNSLLWESRPEIVYACPSDLAELVAAVPLVSYLGAGVTELEVANRPSLIVGENEYTVGRSSGYSPQDILKLTFYLDLLVRKEDSQGRILKQDYILDELGLSSEWLFTASMAERLNRYLNLDQTPSEILEYFPEWHLSLLINPTLNNIKASIPLLRNLPEFIVASSKVNSEESSKREAAPGEVSINQPTGRNKGLIGSGRPQSGFKLLEETYQSPEASPSEHSEDSEGTENLSITLVYNQSEEADVSGSLTDELGWMADEADEAESHYRIREKERLIDIAVKKNLAPEELRDVFTVQNDLVHFIGHCDPQKGLECKDETYLSTSDIPYVGTEVFFLNACQSYSEGRSLIQNGAVAGVVTGDLVPGPEAKTVGSMWAKLMSRGWPVVTALQYACQTIPAERDEWFVIGDGTQLLTQSDATLPPTVNISSKPDSELYKLRIVHNQPIAPGVTMKGTLDDKHRIPGEGSEYEVTVSQLNTVLDGLDSPVLVDGEIKWPDNRDWLN